MAVSGDDEDRLPSVAWNEDQINGRLGTKLIILNVSLMGPLTTLTKPENRS